MKKLLASSIAFVIMPAVAQVAEIKEAPSTTHAQYVEPSVSTAIIPGLKIGHLFERNLKQPYILQRLTDRAYYFQRTFYSTTFYVGEKGVLLFDALEGRGEQLHAAQLQHHAQQQQRVVVHVQVMRVAHRDGRGEAQNAGKHQR